MRILTEMASRGHGKTQGGQMFPAAGDQQLFFGLGLLGQGLVIRLAAGDRQVGAAGRHKIRRSQAGDHENEEQGQDPHFVHWLQ